MSWISILLTVLKIAGAIAGYLKDKQLLLAGEDAAVGRAAVEVLKVTEYGRKLMAKVDAMNDEELSDLEKRLEE